MKLEKKAIYFLGVLNSGGFANTPMAFIRQKKEGGWNILSSHAPPPHRAYRDGHWETATDIHKYLVELGPNNNDYFGR